MRPVPWIIAVLLLASCGPSHPGSAVILPLPVGDEDSTGAPDTDVPSGHDAADRSAPGPARGGFEAAPILDRPPLEGGPAHVDIQCAVPDGYSLADIAAVVADPSAFDGQKIAVRGVVKASPIFTLAFCPPVPGVCCNRQGTWFAVVDEDAPHDALGLAGIGCGVYQCACNAPAEGLSLVFGTVDASGGGAEISVEGACLEP